MERNPVIATYSIWSKTYDTDPNPLIPIEELSVRSLLRTIECEDVLDAATGTGRYALFLAQQGKRVTAVDASLEMLAQAKDKARQKQLTINFQQEDIRQLPFEDASFDLVICGLALAHSKDLKKPCQELVRVLRGGGNLIISDLHPWFQVKYGPKHEIELEGKRYPYPIYHTQVEDYVDAVRSAGATVLAALEIPSRWIPPEGEHVAVPGVLIVWAKRT
jgi:SAM-dependent methyltransferase